MSVSLSLFGPRAPAAPNKSARCAEPQQVMPLRDVYRRPAGMAAVAMSAGSTLLRRLPALALPAMVRAYPGPHAALILVAAQLGVEVGLSPLTGCAETYFVRRLEAELTRDYALSLCTAAAGRAEHWTDAQLNEASRHALTQHGARLAHGASQVAMMAPRAALNLILGAVQLFAMGPISPLALGVIVGVHAVQWAVRMATNRYRLRCEAAQLQAGQGLTGIQAHFWDNMTVGHAINRERFVQSLHGAFERWGIAERQGAMIRSLLMHLEFLPDRLMSALLQTNMLLGAQAAGTRSLVSNSFVQSYQGLSAALRGLGEWRRTHSFALDYRRHASMRAQVLASLAAPRDVRRYIAADRIQLTRNERPLAVGALLEDATLLGARGLWTVRAPNGSGKTTLFTWLKAQHGDRALFLPAHHQLLFGGPPGSSGETVARIMANLDAMPKRPSLILMDEWDANLDPERRAEGAQRIARWAETSVVVQAVHH